MSLGTVLPRTPAAVLHGLHNWIARRIPGQTEKACLEMAEPVRPVFAAAFGEPDCGAAMLMLSTQVTDPSTYVEFHFRYSVDQRVQGDEGFIDGCAITWGGGLLEPAVVADPGPRLGKFSMRRVANLGFLITAFEPCSSTGDTSAGSSSTAGPSTSTTTPATTPEPTTTSPLPTYAPGVPALLAARIARADPATCEIFTAIGATAFAAAYGVADCAAAVATLHTQVTDAEKYSHPDLGGPKATAGANGQNRGRRLPVDLVELRPGSGPARPTDRPPGAATPTRCRHRLRDRGLHPLLTKDRRASPPPAHGGSPGG